MMKTPEVLIQKTSPRPITRSNETEANPMSKRINSESAIVCQWTLTTNSTRMSGSIGLEGQNRSIYRNRYSAEHTVVCSSPLENEKEIEKESSAFLYLFELSSRPSFESMKFSWSSTRTEEQRRMHLCLHLKVLHSSIGWSNGISDGSSSFSLDDETITFQMERTFPSLYRWLTACIHLYAIMEPRSRRFPILQAAWTHSSRSCLSVDIRCTG